MTFTGKLAACLRAAQAKGLKGTVTAHGNTGWEAKIEGVTNWQPWQYTPEELKKAADAGKTLPAIDVGYLMYEPGWAPGVQYPIVIKRTPKSEDVQTTLFQEQGYKHWGVLSFRGLYPQTPQQILEFRQKRGNMENFIREGKINYDLKHSRIDRPRIKVVDQKSDSTNSIEQMTRAYFRIWAFGLSH